MKSTKTKLIELITVLLLDVVCALIAGLLICITWNVFIAPVFGIAILKYWPSVAIWITVKLLRSCLQFEVTL